ncbi:Retrovirus-related Pol poly from transposon [Paramuricea clavata]|uniref:Retrovirus-related Pol poly from transposon n=1 Tax=Paramuricea clavata TaxID=317549 RepID=A0A7D9F1M7_PARCT|nr:Retrovirus-related Pol poly from transposon [Paramuricea clavata]
MSSQIDEWCKKCRVCQQRRNPVPANRAPLQPITTRRPGELVTMDIVEYPLSPWGYRYCLVMIDHFTKWLEVLPLRNQKAETVAKKGKNLSAKIIEEVCKFLEVWNTRTTPFHPQSDGASERSIRTVNNMLAKVVADYQRNWDLYVSSSCFAYNTAVHSSTGFTPSYLEFGRELRLPNDLVEPGENERRVVSHTDYAQQLKNRLSKAFQIANDILHSAHKTQKHFYDRWARANVYKAGGDLVLWLDRKTRRGRCMKLNRPWTGPWRIIKRLGEVVYRIKYEGSEKVSVKRRVVHHNQLKRFHDVREPDMADNKTVVPEKELSDSPETDDAAVVVIEGPDVAAPIEDAEQDNDNLAEQPEPTNDNERPQRERRPPEWFVNYDMNF